MSAGLQTTVSLFKPVSRPVIRQHKCNEAYHFVQSHATHSAVVCHVRPEVPQMKCYSLGAYYILEGVPQSSGKRTYHRCKANISESTEYEDMPNQDLGIGKRVQHVEPQQRHAVLHDFCMVIPYGALMVLAGLLSLAFKSGVMGLGIAAVGAVQLLLAMLSLGSWRKGNPSTVFTVAAGVGSGVLSYLFYSNLRNGIARLPNAAVLVPSIALTAFLLYNLAAGGNPPKREA